ncbi:MAG: ATP-binding protein [Desulfobacterales bacterium]|nr:ATP-binding protein [Desulfobacterales bacterium]
MNDDDYYRESLLTFLYEQPINDKVPLYEICKGINHKSREYVSKILYGLHGKQLVEIIEIKGQGSKALSCSLTKYGRDIIYDLKDANSKNSGELPADKEKKTDQKNTDPSAFGDDYPVFNLGELDKFTPEYADVVSRNNILNDISKILESDNEKIIYLYGLPKVGKTYVLDQLRNTLKYKFIPVKIDINGWSSICKQGTFLLELAKKICKDIKLLKQEVDIKLFGKVPEEYATIEFTDFLDELCQCTDAEKNPLVLMFDEIEYMTNLASTDHNIYNFLINLIHRKYPVKFIFTGSIDMFNKFKNCPLERILDIGKRIQVGCYDEKVSRDLLDKHASPFFTFNSKARERIQFLTDGHPILLQNIFNIIAEEWRIHKRTIITEDDVNAVFNDIQDKLSYIPKAIFSTLPMVERKVIEQLSQYRQEPFSHESILSDQQHVNEIMKKLVKLQIMKFQQSVYSFRIGILAESVFHRIIPATYRYRQ